MEDLQEGVAMERVVTAHRVRSIIIKFTARLNHDIWTQAFREVRLQKINSCRIKPMKGLRNKDSSTCGLGRLKSLRDGKKVKSASKWKASMNWKNCKDKVG